MRYSGSLRQCSDMKPWISLIPRSVYWPLVHMSHSPTAQLGQGTGSGRRTIPTTRSPALKELLGPGSMTRPRDSCPSTRRVFPGGAQPYFPSTISTSVPQTPTATASTRTEPSRTSGSGKSSYRAVPGFLGSTVIAFMRVSPLYLTDRLVSSVDQLEANRRWHGGHVSGCPQRPGITIDPDLGHKSGCVPPHGIDIAFGQKRSARMPQVLSNTSGKTSIAISQRTPSHCPRNSLQFPDHRLLQFRARQ